MAIDLVRIQLIKKGWRGDREAAWSPQVEFLATFEEADGWTAREILDIGKREFPQVPRCELALVGYPEMPEWDNGHV